MSAAKYHILLLDDGELSEIRAAAQALDAAVHTNIEGADTPVHWPLVVCSTRYLEKLESIAVNLSAKRVVVLDRFSQTLRARMRRVRVDFFLCRPVHPEALRLLLLHCLYTGPERRRRRVAVGAPVRFRSGFRRSSGVLVDLSETGCRILTHHPLEEKQKLLVFLPKAERPSRSFFVRAEVVRTKRAGPPPHQMALLFYSVSNATQRRIDDLIVSHEKGPAVFEGEPEAVHTNLGAGALSTATTSEARADEPPTPGAEPPPLEASDAGFADDAAPALETDPESHDLDIDEVLAPFHAGPAAGDLEPGEAQTDAPADEMPEMEMVEERRREPRRAFDRHVVALDRSATRILIGRDLSVGGMRVDPSPALLLRKTFRLSIHVGENELPLVVRARVIRDDGAEGMVLRFEQIGFALQEHLRKSLGELPILAVDEDGAPQGVLVTQILDDRAAQG